MDAKLHVKWNHGKPPLHAVHLQPAALKRHHFRMVVSEKEFARAVGRRLKLAREAATPKLTQQDVADWLANETRSEPFLSSRVSNWETGFRLVDPLTLQLLARLYGVTAAWLYGFTEAPQSLQEQRILEIFRATDDRGRQSIWRVTEHQPVYNVMPNDKAG